MNGYCSKKISIEYAEIYRRQLMEPHNITIYIITSVIDKQYHFRNSNVVDLGILAFLQSLIIVLKISFSLFVSIFSPID